MAARDLGYVTTSAAGAEEAMAILLERGHEIDVELGREIRRLYPGLRVILTSG